MDRIGPGWPDAGVHRPAADRLGWECPVCHKGNAPHADRCGHCAAVEIKIAPLHVSAEEIEAAFREDTT